MNNNINLPMFFKSHMKCNGLITSKRKGKREREREREIPPLLEDQVWCCLTSFERNHGQGPTGYVRRGGPVNDLLLLAGLLVCSMPGRHSVYPIQARSQLAHSLPKREFKEKKKKKKRGKRR